MDSKELRIDNYVNHDGREIEIGLIHFMDMLKFPNERRKYSPILLTKEWLIKLDMFKDESINFDCWLIPLEDNCSIQCWFNSEKEFIIHFGYGSATHIKYVHQLQNIYYTISGQDLIKKL